MWEIALVITFTALTAILLLLAPPRYGKAPQPAPKPVPDIAATAGPPWVYGRADARYLLIEYADLECPYCQAHFMTLRPWMDAHADLVALEWRHLPLSMHEPAATQEARRVECAGEAGGHAAFWDAVAWTYRHTRGSGEGLPAGQTYPHLDARMQACLDSDRPDAVIRAQAQEALQANINATPTFRLLDRHSGKGLMLHGPIEGDALLSAMDFLAAPAETTPEQESSSADVIGEAR